MKLYRYFNLLIPIVSVLLGLLCGAVIMLVSGYDPILGYEALFNGIFGDPFYIGETVRQLTPYILTGLAVAFAFRTGLFNIGVEGQVIVGWLAAVWVGLAFDLPKIIHLPLAILAAIIAGALWGFVPGYLKARFKVHEVIVSIMMNYIALYVTNYLIQNVLTDSKDQTELIHPSASLKSDFLASITGDSSMHNGIYISIIAAAVMWVLLEKTTKGFELRAVGYNQDAAHYAGMNVNRNIILSMVISGAFAGVAGAMEGLGTFNYVSVKSAFTGIGFDGIAVALLGGNTPIGIIFSAFLFGALKIGALNMPMEANVPNELVEIVIALIIFFVASSYFIRWILLRFKKEGK